MPLASGLPYAPLRPGADRHRRKDKMGTIREFIHRHFRHFNAAVLVEAADAYRHHLKQGGRMLVTLAGAMSTAELGLSLAEMIRKGKVHAISCTGANLEEDIFNLVAHRSYKRLPHYRELSAKDEEKLMVRHLYRVTDTCIPENKAVRRLEREVLKEWRDADRNGKAYFPHEFLYRILLAGKLKPYQIDQKDSWVLAAAQKGLPIFVPGWEDSTLGNTFASHVITRKIKKVHTVKTGIDYMVELASWYQATCRKHSVRVLPNRRRHSRGFPNLRCTHARTEPEDLRYSALGLFLPDQRLDHQLRVILGCSSKREDLMGQALGRDTEVHYRVRRYHRGTAYFR